MDTATDQLHDNKLACIDSVVTPEILKRGGDFIRAEIHRICNEVYETGKGTVQWNTSILVPVTKKENLQIKTT